MYPFFLWSPLDLVNYDVDRQFSVSSNIYFEEGGMIPSWCLRGDVRNCFILIGFVKMEMGYIYKLCGFGERGED